MSRWRSERSVSAVTVRRRRYTEEFQAEAVQLLGGGHSAPSACERLGCRGRTCCTPGSDTARPRRAPGRVRQRGGMKSGA